MVTAYASFLKTMVTFLGEQFHSFIHGPPIIKMYGRKNPKWRWHGAGKGSKKSDTGQFV